MEMVHCRECGIKISETASNCPKCGAKQKSSLSSDRKNKTTALLLAIFLSFWTWLYTFDKDKNKFWIGLGVSIGGIFLAFIPSIGIWIWAIVDTVKKDENWFQQL